MIFTRRATLTPSTYDAETRTIEVVWSAGAAVQRRDAQGAYIERLSLDAAHVDLSRLQGGPVFLDHIPSVRALIGVVERAWIEGGRGLARIKLSSRDDVAGHVRDLAEGILRNFSVGYSVQEWRDSTDSKGNRTRLAVRWTPLEVSAVGIAADPAAKVRGGSRVDPELEDNAPVDPANPQTRADPATQQPNATATRNAAFRALGTQTGMTREFVDSHVDNPNTDMIAFRAAVNAEMIRTSQAQTPINPRTAIVHSNEDPSVVRERRIEARFTRDTGAAVPEASRAYARDSVLDWAREALTRAGVSTKGMSPDEIFQRAATHGTSDFPEHLTGLGQRVVLAGYTAAPAPIRSVARGRTVVDFRSVSALRLSHMGLLEEVDEHGKITSTTQFETKEAYVVKTFARAFGISRKALVNDDLSVFNDTGRKLGIAASQTEAAQLISLLESNPQLEDGDNVFDVTRGNLVTAETPISIDSVGDARLNMRKLEDEDGTLISVGPRFLLVSAELETTAQQFVSSFQPVEWEKANPLGNLQVLVEPRLAAFSWYLFADPALAPVLEFAHLAGTNGPVVESRPAWTTLGVETRCYLDFGAGVVGWKGAHKFEDGESG